MDEENADRYEWLKEILRPLKPEFIEILVVSFFANLLALAVPIFTLQVYDRVVGHQAMTTLIALVIGVILALIFDFVLRRGRSKILQHNAVHIDAHLGQYLYERFSRLPLATLESKPTNYWRSLFQDTQVIRSVFSGPSAVLLADIPFALLFIIVIFIIATPIAWALLLIVPAFLGLTWWSTKALNKDTVKETQKNLSHDSLISELLAGRTTVKALMIDATLQPEYERRHASSIEGAFHRGNDTDFFIALGQSLTTVSTAILVTLGALAIIAGDMTIGALIATTMLTGRIVAPMNQLLTQWRGFSRCLQAVRHLSMLNKLPQEKQKPTMERERPAGKIEVENLSFCYPHQEQPLIRQCNFQLKPGEMVGIVGRNGCGKTTLVKLLQGLYAPTDGRILLDGADITQFSREEMTRWVGYVPQECFLFTGTIRENIVKAWPEASDQSIITAAKLAGADRFIADLPEGYETEIGEGGFMLSGGQRQRLAIARALLRNPAVLLLDEVSSNLDSESEMILRSYLLALAKERTILLATHSLSLLRACHRILVMDKGAISLDGPAEEVLAKITGQDPATLAKAKAAAQAESEAKPKPKPKGKQK